VQSQPSEKKETWEKQPRKGEGGGMKGKKEHKKSSNKGWTTRGAGGGERRGEIPNKHRRNKG